MKEYAFDGRGSGKSVISVMFVYEMAYFDRGDDVDSGVAASNMDAGDGGEERNIERREKKMWPRRTGGIIENWGLFVW
jgi:hypothetical protein